MHRLSIQQPPSEQIVEQPQTNPPSEAAEQERWPLIEVFSEDGKLVVTADLPGVPAEDITVRTSALEVRLIGERRRAPQRGARQYFEQEPHFGRFERVIQLPKRVKPQSLKAHIDNGLLALQAELAGD